MRYVQIGFSGTHSVRITYQYMTLSTGYGPIKIHLASFIVILCHIQNIRIEQADASYKQQHEL